MSGRDGWDTQGQYSGQAAQAEHKTLWMGEIENWMDENYVHQMITATGYQPALVRLIRDKSTGLPAGYGFIDFPTREMAQAVVDGWSGKPVPGVPGKVYRINWSSQSAGQGGGGGNTSSGETHSIYVGDLDHNADETQLRRIFSKYNSMKEVKIITDPVTGAPKGYGFVRFSDPMERDQALAEMQGQIIGTRPIKLNIAMTKSKTESTSSSSSLPSNDPAVNDPTNTTIFIGGIDESVSEDMLRGAFARYGDLVYARIPGGRGCGFVQYTTRESAENCLELNGTNLGNCKIRVSWGRPSRSSSSSSNNPNMISNTPSQKLTTIEYYLDETVYGAFAQQTIASKLQQDLYLNMMSGVQDSSTAIVAGVNLPPAVIPREPSVAFTGFRDEVTIERIEITEPVRQDSRSTGGPPTKRARME
mmetsp:Transcript_8504/g.24005  ORF Transcript_8504/g.24005 Transcript_8504/m.24005 type:complete len:418 (+) Transcript_8504:49-1302(+)|eukprot:CAMPEP_0119127292 /NCGR_PEP_ID=MMETSP1310-20130426/5895_1 /TAXON_ID=464262 /ORGANISM="Genus nov. species nov., Strain RCC2339" /LENGTH=417 /DNA_ID=CAMNT_0007117539 /DNA_START=49 /DNA_END=1302 /DNA_ORIENTATION=-